MNERDLRQLRKLVDHVVVVGPALWPKRTDEFDAMSRGLRNAVSHVVMRSWSEGTLENWFWDIFEQKFDFSVTGMFRLGADPTTKPVMVSKRFEFDPTKPWNESMIDLGVQIEAFADDLLRAQRRYLEPAKQ